MCMWQNIIHWYMITRTSLLYFVKKTIETGTRESWLADTNTGLIKIMNENHNAWINSWIIKGYSERGYKEDTKLLIISYVFVSFSVSGFR